MKKITKLLLGCLLLLILFCFLTVCLAVVFWKKFFEFLEPYFLDAGINISNVSLEIVESLLRLAGIL